MAPAHMHYWHFKWSLGPPSPLRQWCWLEFQPASIMAQHGKWRVMACQLAALDWFFSGFQSPMMASIATLLQYVRYVVLVYSGKWDIRAVFFVGMLGGNRQEMLGGNNFHTASSCYFMFWKLTHSSASKAVVSLHTYSWISLNIYLH